MHCTLPSTRWRMAALRSAAEAARHGAQATAAMRKAKAGRSAYLGDDQLLGVVDPGAQAVAEAFGALAKVGEPA